jgi:hypothetical protein
MSLPTNYGPPRPESYPLRNLGKYHVTGTPAHHEDYTQEELDIPADDLSEAAEDYDLTPEGLAERARRRKLIAEIRRELASGYYKREGQAQGEREENAAKRAGYWSDGMRTAARDHQERLRDQASR